ncbi:MAG: phospho-sugar mutase, partial [Candidatus Sumerlaeia bacterium]|nr:phospho-sugar mutase [Candidatus Sumerlaeia bacterium]
MSSLTYSSPEIAARVTEWSSPAYDSATRQEVEALAAEGNVKELEDRFYRTLEFGTGGLRGLMGAGTNRMNKVIVSRATQGLANYVKAHAAQSDGFKPGPLRAAIAHDSRHRSREFAEAAACVLAANGIICHLSPELRPTPYLSFAVRHLGCHTGIVVTASHNPKEYNGYKVYWNDGSQVVPPHDKGIIREVNSVENDAQVLTMPFDKAVALGMIQIMGKEMDEAYIEAILQQRIDAESCRKSAVRVVYTPLHGCGGTLALTALDRWGFTHVFPEEEQMRPNGDFPT